MGGRAQLRERLVVEARKRLRESWLQRGARRPSSSWVDSVLDPDVLTIGFARRVPSYKRLTLMLRDPDRLKALLLHPERPIQLVIAGKAHPADDGGKQLIQEHRQLSDDPEVRHRIVFLPNYDMAMAKLLYPGCDVWLNNPLRPYEACGTSGHEGRAQRRPQPLGARRLVGRVVRRRQRLGDPHRRRRRRQRPARRPRGRALYDLIENEVAPRFYDRDARRACPTRWLEMVRHTLKSLGPKVLATRMVRDYVSELYAPAAGNARLLNSDYGGAAELAAWKKRVTGRLGRRCASSTSRPPVSGTPPRWARSSTSARSSPWATSPPSDVDVQLCTARVDANDILTDTTVADLTLAETYDGGRYRFEGDLVLDHSGPFGYTVRVMPRNDLLAAPPSSASSRCA